MKLIKGITISNSRDTSVCEKDVKKIADWGYDHVRLLIDVDTIETSDGRVNRMGYYYIDRIISYCSRNGLNVVLAIENPKGCSLNGKGKTTGMVFENSSIMYRYLNLWSYIADNTKDFFNVAYEILNEEADTSVKADQAQVITSSAIAIRAFVPGAPIIYDGIQWSERNGKRTKVRKYNIPKKDFDAFGRKTKNNIVSFYVQPDLDVRMQG